MHESIAIYTLSTVHVELVPEHPVASGWPHSISKTESKPDGNQTMKQAQAKNPTPCPVSMPTGSGRGEDAPSTEE